MVDQVHALLLVQAADVRNDGAPGLAQPEPLSQRFLVLVLGVEVPHRIAGRYKRVNLGVPHVVVHAVEHATEFALMGPQGKAEAGAAVAMPGLAGEVWEKGWQGSVY